MYCEQCVRDGLQCSVSGLMVVGVVELLEPLDIRHHHDNRRWIDPLA